MWVSDQNFEVLMMSSQDIVKTEFGLVSLLLLTLFGLELMMSRQDIVKNEFGLVSFLLLTLFGLELTFSHIWRL